MRGLLLHLVWLGPLSYVAQQFYVAGYRLGMWGKASALRFEPGFVAGGADAGAKGCRRLADNATSTPLEDLTIVDASRGLYLAAGGWVFPCFFQGTAAMEEALKSPGIFLVDLEAESATPVRTLAPADPKSSAAEADSLVPHSLRGSVFHGTFYSNLTRRFYAINHLAQGSVVDIFVLRLETIPSSEEEFFSYPSKWVLVLDRRVRSSMFGLGNVNDIIEIAADGTSFLVSEWLPPGYAPLTLRSEYLKLVGLAGFFFNAQWSRLLRCDLETEGSTYTCKDALGHQRFQMANGLAVTADRSFAFVNDLTPGIIHAFRISKTDGHEIEHVVALSIKMNLDNLNVAEETADEIVLHGGTLPLSHLTEFACSEGLGFRRTITDTAGREGYLDCGRNAGGISVLRISGLRGQTGSQVRVEESHPVLHDGSMLDGVSAAVLYRDKVGLSSASGIGLLLCDLTKRDLF